MCENSCKQVLRRMPLCCFRNEKSSEVDFWNKVLCSVIELERLESSNRSGFFTSPEGTLTTQHTRKSAPPLQISSQERGNCNDFASKVTKLYNILYALRIPTLNLLARTLAQSFPPSVSTKSASASKAWNCFIFPDWQSV